VTDQRATIGSKKAKWIKCARLKPHFDIARRMTALDHRFLSYRSPPRTPIESVPWLLPAQPPEELPNLRGPLHGGLIARASVVKRDGVASAHEYEPSAVAFS
jgi:hypothetical protein